MTDLRDRIAAAIDRRLTEEAVGHTYEVCLMAADAVIAELQLERQEHYDPSVSAHRFVTDWKADDE